MGTSAQDSGILGTKHRSVYLDQSVYGNMLDCTGGWQSCRTAQILLEAQKTGIAQVWAGPTNVIETIQVQDVNRRRTLASLQLELIEARRMWWGHEFEAIEDFFLFVTTFVPNGIRYKEYFTHHGDVARQTWLGALGIVAATGRVKDASVLASLRHMKAVNRLIHARFALDPGDWVDRMLDAVEGLKTVHGDPLADVEKLSLDEIEREISRLSVGARALDKVALAKLNKNRERIARAYGGIEVGAMLRSVLTLPLDIPLTFNVPSIVKAWDAIQKATGCEALPENIRSAEEDQLLGNPALAVAVVAHLVRAAARSGLMTTALGNQVILREMQRCMNAKELPTGGLTFDADHAAALVRHQVFMTHDEWLAASLKTMAKLIAESTKGKWCPEVVMNDKQLERALS